MDHSDDVFCCREEPEEDELDFALHVLLRKLLLYHSFKSYETSVSFFSCLATCQTMTKNNVHIEKKRNARISMVRVCHSGCKDASADIWLDSGYRPVKKK